MIVVCDLADDLRDAIVEYQVCITKFKRIANGPLIRFVLVLATEGDL
jgi:hypothetical protein